MTLEPLFDNVLVSVEDKQETTESGIVIPDNASMDRPQTGKVTAKGPDVTAVDIGQEVVYKRFSPDEVKIGSEKFFLLSQKDILAVVK